MTNSKESPSEEEINELFRQLGLDSEEARLIQLQGSYLGDLVNKPLITWDLSWSTGVDTQEAKNAYVQ
jgi:hypothetical protein